MGAVIPIRRRAAGLGVVAKVDPLAVGADAATVAKYVERRRIVADRALECADHRQYLGIAAGVGLSLGLTAVLASKSSALRLIGAALAGGGAIAGAGAYYSHTKVSEFVAERDALDKEIGKVTTAPKKDPV